MRKPEPLGTEFKVIADTATGINVGLKIQEGMYPMRAKQYSGELGANAGCSLHLAEMAAHCGQKDDD
jgi:hypothetical protein